MVCTFKLENKTFEVMGTLKAIGNVTKLKLFYAYTVNMSF